MNSELLDQVERCMRQGRFETVLRVLDEEIRRPGPPDWNALYLAGQAERFLHRFDAAETRLRAALQAGGRQLPVLHALGVVLQQKGDLEGACGIFEEALEIDRWHDAVQNSLGLTRKMLGQPDRALHHYNLALDGLCRRIVHMLPNDASGPVLPHPETRGTHWLRKALHTALYLAALRYPEVESVAWPGAYDAAREMEERAHGGLLYKELRGEDGRRVLYFLPNYFNVFCAALRSDLTYAILLNNMGVVLPALDRRDDARSCFLEAIEFTPPGQYYPDPIRGLAGIDP